MFAFLVRILEIIALIWLVRFLWKAVIGERFTTPASRPFWKQGPSSHGQHSASEPRVITGEMKKDPQCGTYVSTELSIRSRYQNQELHFCSRECQQAFLQAHSGKSA